MHKGSEKNILMNELISQDNDVIPNYPPQQKKYLVCLQKFHIARRDTTTKCIHRKHHCNTVLLWGQSQPDVANPRVCVSKRSYSQENNAYLCLQWLGCRSCFFIADKREYFVQFGCGDLVGLGRWWQFFRWLAYPVIHRLMADIQMSGNSPVVQAIHIHLDGFLS